MPGERSAGGKPRKVDVKSFLIQQRLAWLANKRNWDGKLPPPKSLSPAGGGLKRPPVQVQRDDGSSGERGEQAPGWEGQVHETETPTARSIPTGTMRNEAHQNGDKKDGARSYEGENRIETEITPSPSSAGTGRADADVEGGLTGGIANHLADDGNATAMRNIDVAVKVPLLRRSDDWSTPPPTQEFQPFYSKVEPDFEGDSVHSNDDADDGDTAAGDETSKTGGGGGRGGLDGGGERDVMCSFQSGDQADGGRLPGIAPGSDDSVSDLSCAGSFHENGASADGRGVTLHLDEAGSPHDSSSESPKQFQPPTSDSDYDGMSVSHVSHLMEERRQWKLRALEAEHELSSTRSPPVCKERGGEGAPPAVPLPGEGAEDHGTISGTTQASATFRNLFSSEVSAFGSGFAFESRWSTTSDGRMSNSASSSPSDRPGVVVGTPLVEPPITAAKSQLSPATSRTAGRVPAAPGRYEAEGVPATDIGDDKSHIFCRDATDGQGNENDAVILCHQREEVAALKGDLRKAELRYAAAEATAASAMQRARAAEISRDVKEIQIRNLEIRLARHTNGDRHSQHACAEWRKTHPLRADESSTDLYCKVDFDRSHHTEPLSPVVEGDEGAPPSLFERKHPPFKGAVHFSPALPHGSFGALFPAPHERENTAGTHDDGGGRGAMCKFSRSCFDLGTRAARAGGEAMSAAAAAASEAADDIARGRASRKAGQDPRSQAPVDGGLSEEFWGSDYCTPV